MTKSPDPQPLSQFAFCALFASAVIGLVACAPINQIRDNVQHGLSQHHERAFQSDVTRMAKDTKHTYQLDYVVTDEWMSAMLATIPKFRAMEELKFDMTPWLQSNGAKPNPTASAVFDSDKRTITIIDTGPNAALIEGVIEPMRPTHYSRVKTPPPAKQ